MVLVVNAEDLRGSRELENQNQVIHGRGHRIYLKAEGLREERPDTRCDVTVMA